MVYVSWHRIALLSNLEQWRCLYIAMINVFKNGRKVFAPKIKAVQVYYENFKDYTSGFQEILLSSGEEASKSPLR